jgi:hypothetical protein
MMKKQTVLKYMAEAVLIVFSVLLAFILNEYRENYLENNLLQDNLAEISDEIKANLSLLQEALPYHKEVLKNIQTFLKDDSGLELNDRLLLYSIAPDGIIQNPLSSTAWYVFTDNELTTKIDFKTTYQLSQAYHAQEHFVEHIIAKIIDLLISRDAVDKDEIHTTLLMLDVHFNDLIQQETILIEHYKNALKQIEEKEL